MATPRATAICGIYFILCLTNGGVYVGSSANVRQRFNTHFFRLRHGKGINPIIQNAYNKYGAASFTYGLLELVDDPADLLAREQLWLNSGAATFNVNMRADKPPSATGQIYSAERRANISAGIRNSISLKGRKLSPETRAKISATALGKKRDPSAIEKSRLAQSHLHLFEGEMLTLSNISERTGINRCALVSRNARGQPLAAPVVRAQKYAAFGEMLTLSEISKRSGVSRNTLHRRVTKGVPLDAPLRVAKTYLVFGEQLTIEEIAKRTGVKGITLRMRARRGAPLV